MVRGVRNLEALDEVLLESVAPVHRRVHNVHLPPRYVRRYSTADGERSLDETGAQQAAVFIG